MCPFQVRSERKGTVYKPGSGLLPDHICWCCDDRFPSSRTVRNKCLFTSHLVVSIFVTAAQTDKRYLKYCSQYFFFFLWPYLHHMEVSRLGVESELLLLAYATATPDPSCIYDLCWNFWQCRILNPLSEARDPTCVLMDTMLDS